ncbi:MAG: transporter substrate-binding protein [Betaproteobacteria bacterium]|nr:transporter substrate-binding protein [Betaproteobacteria bacterium]
MSRSFSLLGFTVLFAGALSCASAQAQGVEKQAVKGALDWAFQGPQAIFTYAADKGLFKKEGLDAQIDRGSGSADAVTRVASGAYDFGWAEMSAIIKYNAEQPGRELVAVYVTHDHSANAVITIKGRGIASPKDLEGKKVGSSAGSAARDVFGTFAKINGVDASKVLHETVSGSLRETMLVRGDVQAILGAITSGVFTVKSLGIKQEDIISMPYGRYGLDLYGHAVMTTAAFAEKNPRTVAAIVRAVNAALKDAITDPKAVVATLASRDKLGDLGLEQERLQLMLRELVLTPYIKANGLGSVTRERMVKSIQLIHDAYGVKTPPAPEKVYTDRFLPPRAERMPRS